MSELLKVYYLTSTTRSCFFYINNLFNRKTFEIKIQYGENYKNTTFGSISQQPLSEVPDNCIGLASLLAIRLGLKENELVLVSHCNVPSVKLLEISPKKEEDYVILVSCKSILESHLLNQVSVVAEGQTLPLYVFSNIIIDVEIGKLRTNSTFGKLEEFTEIIVLHPSENYEKNRKLKFSSEINNSFDSIVHQLKELLKSIPANKNDVFEKKIIKKLIQSSKIDGLIFEVKPSLMVECDIPQKLKDKYIVISHFQTYQNTWGPCSFKVFAKIKNKRNINVENNLEDNTIVCVHTYVINVYNDDNDDDDNNNDYSTLAFCPPSIMKKLKMHAGCEIIIEPVKPNLELLDHFKNKFSFECSFFDRMSDLQKKIKDCILTNMKYNLRINSLILGDPGTGKTYLLKEIVNEFSSFGVYCKIVNCKSIRGKKLETLLKLLTDYLRECCNHEPSVLVLDDLHAMIYIDEEDEGQFNKFYSKRVTELIIEFLSIFQNNYNLSVLASAVSLSQLSDVVTTRGSRLFQNIGTIPEMNVDERNFVLENLLKLKFKIEIGSVNLKQVSYRTNGYTIQDLYDLVEKAIFKCIIKSEADSLSSSMLEQADFDLALSEITPLNLRDVKLKENIGIRWEDVGGMSKPKKILLEVFFWPSKYPKLLESCPLRLQRGVLLYGAPGTGKTLLAGALAKKCCLNFISVKGPEILSKYVGASEEGVRNLFLRAQKTQPCLLFFDEFDSLAMKRGHDNTGVTDRVVNQLLAQLDGVEALNGVWVLGATSRPDLLDPALLRPGRLDKLVLCEIPDQSDRLSILKILSKNLPIAEGVNLGEIAEKSEGYTGADLQSTLYTSQMRAIKKIKSDLGNQPVLEIQQSHLLEALEETKPSLTKLEKIKYELIYEKFMRSRKRNNAEKQPSMQKVTFA